MDMEVVAGKIAEDFAFLGDWEERYAHIIALGRANEDLPEELRTSVNKVGGCASQVWLVCEADAEGLLWFRGMSDALIVSGLLSLLLSLYTGRRPQEILSFGAEDFFRQIGVDVALSSQRVNGLRSILGHIRAYASRHGGELCS